MVAASRFYFSSTKDKEGSGSVMTGVKFAYFKHAGSIAFGSLVQTFVWVIKQIVEGLAAQASRDIGGNSCVVPVACCAKCCVGCLENVIDYVNKGAYAYIAVTGESYCKSAWNGFLLNLRHTMQFSFANGLAAMFIFMGKLTITCLNVASCYFIMRYGTNKGQMDNSGLIAPLVIVGILSFLTASIFLGQFDEAANATIHCLAVDLDLHDGVPQFGPPSFHEKIAHIY
jgi:choline transporter-like protein 2/4/5